MDFDDYQQILAISKLIISLCWFL